MSTDKSRNVITDLRFPDIEDVRQSLSLNPDEGFVWLGDQRMVIMYADAFGALRQELLQTVGSESSRGLMTRIGYLSGTKDAELALKLRGGGDQLSIIAAGAQLRALAGMTGLEPDRIEFDEQHGFLYGEFTWKHSIESELHARISGGDYRSVCWMEVGHSSAFLSRLLGRQVLVREVECRAATGETCRAIAKPVDQWEDTEDDLKYFQPQSIDHSFRRRAASDTEKLKPIETPITAPTAQEAGERIVGRSMAYHTALHKVLKAATTNATVLFLGESGVGKTMFAHELHRNSRRSAGPFVEINCAAIPEQLIESELFGVHKGAFSGATASRAGRFEAASGGTIFLDEIGTLSMTAQSKLLRVLQSGELERLGSNNTTQVDVRVVAATNENLVEAVRAGRFRSDLFYRINVFPVNIAPLRERREDLPLLLELTLKRLGQQHGRDVQGVTSQAMQKLLDYRWPGNIREFENVVERAVILIEDGDMIDTQHLSGMNDASTQEVRGTVTWDASPQLGVEMVSTNGEEEESHFLESIERVATATLRRGNIDLREVENTFIRAALSLNDNNITRAATRLGMTRAQLDYRVKKVDKSGKSLFN